MPSAHRFQLYQEIIRGVHVMHKLKINHCHIKSTNMITGLRNIDLSVIPDVKLIDLGNATIDAACRYEEEDYQDELGKLNMNKIFGYSPANSDFDSSAHADAHSIAVMILDIEGHFDKNIGDFDVITGIKLLRRQNQNFNKDYGQVHAKVIDWLIDLLGLGQTILPFEDIMYNLEDIIYSFSKLETKAVQNYTPTGEWLSDLKIALREIDSSYNPKINIVPVPDIRPDFVKRMYEEEIAKKLANKIMESKGLATEVDERNVLENGSQIVPAKSLRFDLVDDYFSQEALGREPKRIEGLDQHFSFDLDPDVLRIEELSLL